MRWFPGKPDLGYSLFSAVNHFGGGKGGGGGDFPAPDPIDPAELARQQAEFNRIDVFSPFGSSVFGGPNRRELTISLSPEQQQLLQQQQQAGQQAGELALGFLGQLPSDIFSFGNLPEIPGLGDFGEERSNVEQAFFDRAVGLLDPVFERDTDRLEGQLAARGIPLGSETRSLEFQPLRESRQRSLNQAALDAVLAGGQEQSRLFNQALTSRQQLGQEQLTERTQPLSEIAALLGQQTVQQPTFFNPSPVDVVGPAQLASNQALGLYNSGVQQSQFQRAQQTALMNALIGAGGNIGSAFLFGGFG